jgi:hypothetical protein
LRYRIYENETAMPRAFVVGQARTKHEADDYVAALKAINPRREVLVPHDILPAGPRAEFQPATIVHYTPRRVIVETELQHPGYLVLTDLWYPGWQAKDNGHRVPLLNANAAFRAVPLSAGRHRVVFNYNVPALGVGGLMTLITMFLIFFGTSPWPASVPQDA